MIVAGSKSPLGPTICKRCSSGLIERITLATSSLANSFARMPPREATIRVAFGRIRMQAVAKSIRAGRLSAPWVEVIRPRRPAIPTMKIISRAYLGKSAKKEIFTSLFTLRSACWRYSSTVDSRELEIRISRKPLMLSKSERRASRPARAEISPYLALPRRKKNCITEIVIPK